jgi:hypothetical protein
VKIGVALAQAKLAGRRLRQPLSLDQKTPAGSVADQIDLCKSLGSFQGPQ